MKELNDLALMVLQNLGVGIYLVDSNMNLLWFNQEIKNWFLNMNIAPSDKKCYRIIFSREHPCNNCPVLRISEPDKLEVSNFQLNTFSGKKRQFRFQARRSSYDNDIVMAMDITDLFETERMREDFMATLTHDLRTPLLAELRTLELLNSGVFGSLNEPQSEVIQAILVSTRDLLAMVKNLLEVYRYEAGAKVLSSETFDIAGLVEDCVFDLSALAETKKIKLSTSISEVLPGVFADKLEIWRVLTNLIGNAIEYTDDNGNIIVKVYLDVDKIVVEVEDTGRGIPITEIDQLFERFSQGTSQNISSGTGLGLYLSKKIIQAHNGKIWAKSIPGVGSSFFFSLPVTV